METADKASIEVLLKGLKDKYFETVNEALYALNVLLVKHRSELEDSFSEIETQVRPFLRSKEYDQRMNAFGVLIEIVDSWEAISADFRANYFHPKWKLRKKLVSCFARLHSRGFLSEQQLQDEFSKILPTSNGFDMHFQLKQEIKDTLSNLKRAQAESEFKQKLSEYNGDAQKGHQLEALIMTYRRHGRSLDLKRALDTIIEQEHIS